MTATKLEANLRLIIRHWTSPPPSLTWISTVFNNKKSKSNFSYQMFCKQIAFFSFRKRQKMWSYYQSMTFCILSEWKNLWGNKSNLPEISLNILLVKRWKSQRQKRCFWMCRIILVHQFLFGSHRFNLYFAPIDAILKTNHKCLLTKDYFKWQPLHLLKVSVIDSNTQSLIN